MAYRRRGEKISQAKRLKVQARERRQIQASLDAIEFAKQREARKRAEYGREGLGWAAIASLFIPGLGAAGWAAMLTAGKAAGDVAYHQGGGDKPGEQIQDEIDTLEALQDDMVFRETGEAARKGVMMGEMAKEDISGGDLATGLMTAGSDFLTYYTTLAAMGKLQGAGADGKNIFDWWSGDEGILPWGRK
jgi:hypothetical protein